MTKIHAEFEQIHPFADGNGRTGRLIMLAQALHAGYLPPWSLNSASKLTTSIWNKPKPKCIMIHWSYLLPKACSLLVNCLQTDRSILNMKISNPWQNLSEPYILPEDLEIIRSHKYFSNLRLGAVPEQVIGGLNSAEVIFLLLNPGFEETDVTVNLHLPGFVKTALENLKDPFNSKFYYLDNKFQQTGGYKWWSSRLRPLLEDGATKEMLSTKIMSIEYFPYHSVKYKNLPIIPSQKFAFSLVREAVRRNKVIVILRSQKLWFEAVPELENYPCMTPNSKQNVIISPKNIGKHNFNTILRKITD